MRVWAKYLPPTKFMVIQNFFRYELDSYREKKSIYPRLLGLWIYRESKNGNVTQKECSCNPKDITNGASGQGRSDISGANHRERKKKYVRKSSERTRIKLEKNKIQYQKDETRIQYLGECSDSLTKIITDEKPKKTKKKSHSLRRLISDLTGLVIPSEYICEYQEIFWRTVHLMNGHIRILRQAVPWYRNMLCRPNITSTKRVEATLIASLDDQEVSNVSVSATKHLVLAMFCLLFH